MDPPVRMGVVVTSILHESIHGLLYFYLSHFILQSVIIKKLPRRSPLSVAYRLGGTPVILRKTRLK